MGSRWKCYVSTVFLLLSSFYFVQISCAQSIENVKATFQEGKVIVNYDLKAEANALFSIELYGSHNNYSTPIQLARGDVGKNIKPGLQKRLEWDVTNDLKNYKGEITLELHGDPAILPWAILQPSLKAGLKKGTTGTIQWQGGKPTEDVKLELFLGSNRVQAITASTIANSKKYDWKVPASIKTGSGYTIKLTSGSDGVSSASFKIGRKIPLTVIVVPVALLSGYLIYDKFIKKDKPGPLPPDPDLENAPGVPPN